MIQEANTIFMALCKYKHTLIVHHKRYVQTHCIVYVHICVDFFVNLKKNPCGFRNLTCVTLGAPKSEEKLNFPPGYNCTHNARRCLGRGTAAASCLGTALEYHPFSAFQRSHGVPTPGVCTTRSKLSAAWNPKYHPSIKICVRKAGTKKAK